MSAGYLAAIERALTNSLGSHLSHGEAVALAEDLLRLRTIEGRVIDLLDSADADVAQLLHYGQHLEWDDERSDWIYPGGKPHRRGEQS